jgi:hypothetical protein
VHRLGAFLLTMFALAAMAMIVFFPAGTTWG